MWVRAAATDRVQRIPPLVRSSDRFNGAEGDTDFVDAGSVTSDGFVEPVACDAKLFGPVGDVGCHLGVDLFRVVRTLDVIFMKSVWFLGFVGVASFGH